MKNFFGSLNEKGVGKVLFFTFEIIALCIAVLGMILAIYMSALSTSFWVFVQTFIQYTFYTAVVFGVGKVIDVLYFAHVIKYDNPTTKTLDKDDED